MRLRAALRDRKGTPFRNGMGVKGAGYDCWHLAVDVYAEAGLDTRRLEHLRGTGSLNWAKFHNSSPLLDALHEDAVCRARLRRLEADEPILAGDLLAIRQGQAANHLAIAESATVAWHVPRGGSVGQVAIETLRAAGFLHAIFRIHHPTP